MPARDTLHLVAQPMGRLSLPRFGGVGKRGIYSTEGGKYAKATKDLYT